MIVASSLIVCLNSSSLPLSPPLFSPSFFSVNEFQRELFQLKNRIFSAQKSLVNSFVWAFFPMPACVLYLLVCDKVDVCCETRLVTSGLCRFLISFAVDIFSSYFFFCVHPPLDSFLSKKLITFFAPNCFPNFGSCLSWTFCFTRPCFGQCVECFQAARLTRQN